MRWSTPFVSGVDFRVGIFATKRPFFFVCFVFFVECCIFNAIEQVGGRIHHGARVSLKLSVFLCAFFGLVFPGFIPTSSSLTRSRCVTVTHPNFFCRFFFPEKDVSKAPHTYFRFPNQKNWLKNHVLDRCFFGDFRLGAWSFGSWFVLILGVWGFFSPCQPPFLDKAP